MTLSLDVKNNKSGLDIKDLRYYCRQNGFHLVNYDDKYNKISNKS